MLKLEKIPEVGVETKGSNCCRQLGTGDRLQLPPPPPPPYIHIFLPSVTPSDLLPDFCLAAPRVVALNLARIESVVTWHKKRGENSGATASVLLLSDLIDLEGGFGQV